MKRRRDGFAYSVVDLLVVLLVIFLARSIDTSDAASTAKGPVSAGNLTVQMTWDREADADVDLWCLGPDEPHAVGFSSPHGHHFDLVRDDLGRSGDPESRNMEIAFARGAPAGEYIVNAMLYASHDNKLPVHVQVELIDGHNETLLHRTAELTYPTQEITVARFRLDDHGALVANSVNDLYRPLYAAGGRHP
jgi:hypothetical protein